MNKNPPPNNEAGHDQKQRHAALAPPAIGLIAIIAIAAALYWQAAADNIQATRPPDMDVDPALFIPPIALPPADVLDQVLIKAYVQINPGAREVKREPLALPPCDLPKAVREGGIVNERDGFRDQAVVWTVPGIPPAQVDQHYLSLITAKTHLRSAALVNDTFLGSSAEPFAPRDPRVVATTMPATSLDAPATRIFAVPPPKNQIGPPLTPELTVNWEVLVARFRALPSGGTRVVLWHRKLIDGFAPPPPGPVPGLYPPHPTTYPAPQER